MVTEEEDDDRPVDDELWCVELIVEVCFLYCCISYGWRLLDCVLPSRFLLDFFTTSVKISYSESRAFEIFLRTNG